MSINEIHLENFLAFKNITIKPVNGINILVGKNGTGKTQVLKTIYGVTDSMEGPVGRILLECFSHGMKQADLQMNDKCGPVIVKLSDDKIPAEKFADTIVGKHDADEAPDAKESLLKITRFTGAMQVVYIPVKDMLTHAKGLIAMSEKYRDFPFDRTLTRIIQKANQWGLKKAPALFKEILPHLEALLDGQIIIENEEFFVKKKDGRLISFAAEAEGLKKIGLLWQLLMNESITENSIFLWDEPEANLNPEYLPVVVECLLELSRHNVQIFVSTHNYLFAKYFDVRKRAEDQVAFHALYEDGDRGIQCEKADLFASLKNNAIMDAYNKLLDEVYGLQVGE